MSKEEVKQIEKNLKLSADFHRYLLRHPEMLHNMPKGVHIVLDSSVHSSKKDGKELYYASKKKGKWTLSPV